MTNTKRIATVKATGDRYIVQQLDMRTGKVHCWGELTAYRGLSTKHGPSITFDRADVDVAESMWTQVLVNVLFAQAQRNADAMHGPRRQVKPLIDAGTIREIASIVDNMNTTLAAMPKLWWCPTCDLCTNTTTCKTCGSTTKAVR